MWVLIVLGVMTVLVGVLLLVVATVLSDASTSFGIVIFFGPIPIVVGSGPHSVWLILLAIILTVLSVVIFLVYRRGTEKSKL
ncbi:MAG: TIGR00304 family membrane protein [Thermoproteota archaeon]